MITNIGLNCLGGHFFLLQMTPNYKGDQVIFQLLHQIELGVN